MDIKIKDFILKKVSSLLTLLCLSTSPVYAGLYLGPTVTYESFYMDDLRYQAISPRLTVGYGDWYTNWMYLGAEAFGSPKDYHLNNNDTLDQTLKVRYSFGGSLIPGIYLDNIVMGYLRLGVTYAKFSQTDQTVPGIQGGIGLDVTAIDCWHVRGEYDFAKFRQVGAVDNPRSDEFSVSLIYHFEPTEV